MQARPVQFILICSDTGTRFEAPVHKTKESCRTGPSSSQNQAPVTTYH